MRLEHPPGTRAALDPAAAPWSELGSAGPLLHFAHGNGFPPGAYRVLLEALAADYRVVAMAARPLWGASTPAELTGWRQLAQDLRQGLQARGFDRVAGVGHSLGGVTSALAAAAEPERFSALVLIDPVLFTGPRSWLWGATKALGLAHRLPLALRARRRRERWRDREEARAAWSRLAVFSTWREEALDDYVACGLVEAAGGGVGLRFPRDWEARVFEVTPASVWPELRALTVPTLFVRGRSSTTFTAAAAERALREVPGARLAEVPDTGHFLPMERPRELARLVLEFLASCR